MCLSQKNTVYQTAEIISVRQTPYGMYEFAVLLDDTQFEYPKYGFMTLKEAKRQCKQDYHIGG